MATIAVAVGVPLIASACGSGSAERTEHASVRTPKTKAATGSAADPAARSGFAPGPDPCGLLSAHDILVVVHERMSRAGESGATCSYVNAQGNGDVSITTATMRTPALAEHAVTSTARTVHGNVRRLHGIGDAAVAYLTSSRTRSVATVLFAKGRTFVFLYRGGTDPGPLMRQVVALAEKAASRS